MKVNFQLDILYTTIAVIQPNENFNDWNDTHYKQGFAWRPTSVPFGTFDDSDFMCWMRIKHGTKMAFRVKKRVFKKGRQAISQMPVVLAM